jgi:hypothetical protein
VFMLHANFFIRGTDPLHLIDSLTAGHYPYLES